MTEKKSRRSIGMWLGNFLRVALLLFLTVNIYAIALRYIPVPTTILMVQRSLSSEEIKRDWTKLEDISPYMVEAVMAGEDSRFCEHEGLDWKAIGQAFEDNQEGGRRRGGSTISQQTAKNVFFWNGGGYLRKAGEAWFASLIDFAWGKSRVMEVYLNVAEWGDGIFGVEAAAQVRFGKAAKDVTQQEAALLAAVLPSPNKWRLDPPSDFVQKRAGILRQRMKLIRNSAYALCIDIADAPRHAPAVPTETPPETAVPSEEKVEDETSESSLKEILERAEESLKKKEDDMTQIQNQTPPEPKPTEIPQPGPSTIPSTPDEIAPDIAPEIPDNTPQEIPTENPPNEIPHRTDPPQF